MNAAIAVNAETDITHFIKAFDGHAEPVLKPDRTVITLVGEKIKESETLPVQVLRLLDKIPVEMISFGASNMNLCLVVEKKYLKSAVKQLHDYFFKDIDEQLFVRQRSSI